MEYEKGTVKAVPISYELNLISAGEEIIFWGNDLKMKSNIKGTSKYTQLLNLNNGRMAATKENREFDIINLYTKEIEFTLKGHTKNIVAICTIDTGNINEHIIATAAYDHTIRIWNILNKECISVIECSGYISVLIYDPRTGYLMNSADGIVTIRNYKTLEIIREIDHGRVKIYQLLQTNEEQIISVCNFAKLSLRIWNIENGETIKDIYIPNSMGFVCGVLLDKNILLLGEADTGRVYTYDLITYTVTNTYQIHHTGGNITQISILNKEEAISCSKDKTIKLFGIKTGEIKITLNEHKSEVNSILPVLFPLNAQFENNSYIPKEYIIQIGEYAYTIGNHLLHRIAPKFRFNIHQRAENIIQIEYMDADISFNHVFKPFIDNQLVINEDNLAEAILLGKYFPLIKIMYEHFIKQHSAGLLELFDINKTNTQLWNNIFSNHAQNKSKHYSVYIFIDIFIKFHDGNYFMTDKTNFCERTSLSFWESIHEEYENNQRYYLLSNKQIISLESLINSKKCIKEGYESIKRYLKGEEIIINSSNYSYLLSFAYYEKLHKLRKICEEVHRNIFFEERIKKQYFHSHFDSNIIY